MLKKARIYLDHNASSLLRPCVKAAISDFLQNDHGNASSIHALGRKSRDCLDLAREQISAFVGVPMRELILTSGGTESNHLAWNAFVHHEKKQSILSSNTEHPCIMGSQDLSMARQNLHHLNFKRGISAQQTIADTVDGTVWDFCSVHMANNETGMQVPLNELVNALIQSSDKKPFVHLDAVQALGKMDMSAAVAYADYLTLSGHKLGALPGTGVLVKKDGVPLKSLWQGSAQEKGRRGGTENILGVVAMGAACVYLQEHQAAEQQKTQSLRDALEAAFSEHISGIEVVAKNEARLGNTSCIIFEGVDAQALLVAADLEGIDVSTGAACTSGSVEPSHVLLNMGYSKAQASAAIRFSLGWNNSAEEIEQVCKIFPKLVERARKTNT